MNNAVYTVYYWQSLNMAGKIPFMSDGQFAMPLVVRIPAHRIDGMDVLVDAQTQPVNNTGHIPVSHPGYSQAGKCGVGSRTTLWQTGEPNDQA